MRKVILYIGIVLMMTTLVIAAKNLHLITEDGTITINTSKITGTTISCNNISDIQSGDPCNPGSGTGGNGTYDLNITGDSGSGTILDGEILLAQGHNGINTTISSNTLSIGRNTSIIQSRVTGTCIGSVMVSINEDGTVNCEVDDTAAGGSNTLNFTNNTAQSSIDIATQVFNITGNGSVNVITTSNGFILNGIDTDTTYTAGQGITLTGTQFNHTDTSSQASSDNSGRTYIQDIILDTFGHITSIVTATETIIDTIWGLTGKYIYNNSGSLDINETSLNATIDARDQDTTYTATNPYIILTGTAFSWNETKGNATYINNGETAGGGLGGTYPNPSVTDDGHSHTQSTVTIHASNVTAGELSDARVSNNLTINTSQVITTYTNITFAVAGQCLNFGNISICFNASCPYMTGATGAQVRAC